VLRLLEWWFLLYLYLKYCFNGRLDQIFFKLFIMMVDWISPPNKSIVWMKVTRLRSMEDFVIGGFRSLILFDSSCELNVQFNHYINGKLRLISYIWYTWTYVNILVASYLIRLYVSLVDGSTISWMLFERVLE